MGTERLEAFSDGVFAIAITLLVLEIKVPPVEENLGPALLDLWSSYAAYVVSFVTIGMIWISHHFHFMRVEKVNRPLLYWNLLLLMLVAFLPFPTAVLADHLDASTNGEVAAIFYALTLAVTTAVFTILSYYDSTRGLVRSEALRAAARPLIRHGTTVSLAYLLIVPVALISPVAGLVGCGLLALSWVIPSRRTAQVRQSLKEAENESR